VIRNYARSTNSLSSSSNSILGPSRRDLNMARILESKTPDDCDFQPPKKALCIFKVCKNPQEIDGFCSVHSKPRFLTKARPTNGQPPRIMPAKPVSNGERTTMPRPVMRKTAMSGYPVLSRSSSSLSSTVRNPTKRGPQLMGPIQTTARDQGQFYSPPDTPSRSGSNGVHSSEAIQSIESPEIISISSSSPPPLERNARRPKPRDNLVQLENTVYTNGIASKTYQGNQDEGRHTPGLRTLRIFNGVSEQPGSVISGTNSASSDAIQPTRVPANLEAEIRKWASALQTPAETINKHFKSKPSRPAVRNEKDSTPLSLDSSSSHPSRLVWVEDESGDMTHPRCMESVEVASLEQERLRLIESHDESAFDSWVSNQETQVNPLTEVLQRQQQDEEHSNGEPYFGHIDPRLHWTQRRSNQWYSAKQAEIKARGGRKANFGKVAERRAQQQKLEKILPLEERVPLHVKIDPARLRATVSADKRETDRLAMERNAARERRLANWTR